MADSGWNNSALTDAFLHGLSPKVKDQLISLDIPDNLDGVIALTNKINRQIQDSEKDKNIHFFVRTDFLSHHSLNRLHLKSSPFQRDQCNYEEPDCWQRKDHKGLGRGCVVTVASLDIS